MAELAIETQAVCLQGLSVLNHDAMLPVAGYSEHLVEQKALHSLIVVRISSICQSGKN